MSFWRAETLSKRLPALKLIDPYDPDAIDCAAYTLHVGNEIYVSPDQKIKNPDRHTKQKLADGECFAIPPGQFAFVSTKETVAVPDDAIAFLSIKARTKFRGLINISGFHVDPGYGGKLLFSVLNAGPRPLHLQQGDALFLIWYADLDGQTENKKKGQGFGGIDPTLINGISGEILSLQSLSDKQRVLEKDMATQKTSTTIMITVLVALVAPVLVALVAPVLVALVAPVIKWLGATTQNLFGTGAP